jgi:hypothetical protein
MTPLDITQMDKDERALYDAGRAAAAAERKPLKRSEVMAMSTREVADRKREVDHSLKHGFAPEDDE